MICARTTRSADSPWSAIAPAYRALWRERSPSFGSLVQTRTRSTRIPRVSCAGSSALRRLQAGLFSAAPHAGTTGDDVVILSAPGESRECVEIARIISREAARGIPFDKIAILLRSPEQYRAHLEEALRRAAIPA